MAMKTFSSIFVLLVAIVTQCQSQPLVQSNDLFYPERSDAEKESPQFNLEHDIDVKWNDDLLDYNSKNYKELESVVKDTINRVGNPDFQFHSLESFKKTDDNKVRTKAIVMLRLPKSFPRSEKDSQEDLTRERRLDAVALEQDLDANGVQNVEITSNGRLGHVCDDSQQNLRCQADHAVCKSKVCGCPDGFLQIGNTKDKCFQRRNFGEPCEKDKQCNLGTTQECGSNDICVCKSGFFEATDELMNTGCHEERTDLGAPCTITRQCENIAHATCHGDFCVCANNYQQVENTNNCVGTVALGDACTEDSECSVQFSECSSSNTCSCSFGFNEIGDTCVHDDKCSKEDTSSCQNGTGICVNWVPTWRCECSVGYQNPAGNNQTCEFYDQCSKEDTSSCQSGTGNCVNWAPTWRCECSVGYHNPAGNNQTCEFIPSTTSFW